AAALPVARRAPARAAAAGSATFTSAGPMLRRLTFSTTTALVRPWLKLCRTTPCSTPRLSVSVPFVEATLSVFSPGFFVSVSLIQLPIRAPLKAAQQPLNPVPGVASPHVKRAGAFGPDGPAAH